jgi:hypothetical protein
MTILLILLMILLLGQEHGTTGLTRVPTTHVSSPPPPTRLPGPGLNSRREKSPQCVWAMPVPNVYCLSVIILNCTRSPSDLVRKWIPNFDRNNLEKEFHSKADIVILHQSKKVQQETKKTVEAGNITLYDVASFLHISKKIDISILFCVFGWSYGKFNSLVGLPRTFFPILK